MTNLNYLNLYFDAPAGMTGTHNIDTQVRQIDFVTSFQKDLQALLDILGISRLIKKENGSTLKMRKVAGTLQSGDVAEGELIPASEYKVQDKPIGLIKLKKHKKTVSVEAIADKGYDAAVQATDDEMKGDLRDEITETFYDTLHMGALCGTRSTFQASVSYAIGAVKNRARKIKKNAGKIAVFVNIVDFYDYLGGAPITTQTLFGQEYIENFLGADIMFLCGDEQVAHNKVYAVPVNDIVAYYVNPSDSEFARAGLNYYVDGDTGFVGFAVNGDYDRALSNAYTLSGIRMLCEYIDLVANVDIDADGPALTVAPVTDATVDLLGKVCTDLQSGVTIEDGLISGNLKYVDDYTGFSGAPAEQVGNYLAVKAESVDGATITATNIGGKRDGRTVTLDSDGILITQIFNEFTQKIKFVATKDGKSTTRTFGLTGLWLDNPDDEE